MKRILISAAAVLAALFIIHACTRESDDRAAVPQTTEAEAFEQLNVIIDNYNKSFFAQAGISQTRSNDVIGADPNIPKEDIRFRQLVKADLGGIGLGMLGGGLLGGWIGALIGGLINGIIASVKAGRESNGYDIALNSNVSSYYEYYHDLKDGNMFDYAGVAHNIVINNMAQLYGKEFLMTASDRELFDAALKEIEKLGYDTSNVTFDAAIIVKHFDEIYDAIISGNSDDIIKEFVKVCPSAENEARVIASYMKTIDELDTIQLKEYATGYRKIIINSDINETSKNAINAAISTSVGSAMLWKVEN